MDESARKLLLCVRDIGTHLARLGEAIAASAEAAVSGQQPPTAGPRQSAAANDQAALRASPVAATPLPKRRASAPLNGSADGAKADGSAAPVTPKRKPGRPPKVKPVEESVAGVTGGVPESPGAAGAKPIAKRSFEQSGIDKAKIAAGANASKRSRVNWSSEEDRVLVDVLEATPGGAEKDLVLDIVNKLGGKRNAAQVKGHLKNLSKSGAIILENGSVRADSSWAHAKKSEAHRTEIPVSDTERREPDTQGNGHMDIRDAAGNPDVAANKSSAQPAQTTNDQDTEAEQETEKAGGRARQDSQESEEQPDSSDEESSLRKDDGEVTEHRKYSEAGETQPLTRRLTGNDDDDEELDRDNKISDSPGEPGIESRGEAALAELRRKKKKYRSTAMGDVVRDRRTKLKGKRRKSIDRFV